MSLTQKLIYKTVFFTFFLFVSNIIFAQSLDTIKPEVQLHENQIKLLQVVSSKEFQRIKFSYNHSIPPAFSTTQLNKFSFTKENSPLFTDLSFSQSKSINFYPNMGTYEHFNNSMIFNVSNKFTVDFNFGLLKQNTVLTPEKSDFQFTFGTSLEYKINPWLSLYMYGHYLVPTTDAAKDFLDPLIYMNPLFFQTEAAGGVRATYKKINADLGVKRIFDTRFNQSNPSNSVNTKISIGF